MTTAQVSTEVPKGFVIQIGGNKTSLTRPADYVLSASNVPPRGDRRITAQTQRFRESLDERVSGGLRVYQGWRRGVPVTAIAVPPESGADVPGG
jgi:hypothetical protein